MPIGRYYRVIMLEYDTKVGCMLFAHSVRGVMSGMVLFGLMICKGVTCTGLDRTKLR